MSLFFLLRKTYLVCYVYNLSTISYFLRKSKEPSPAPPVRRESCFLRSANRRRSSAAVIFKFNVVVVGVVAELLVIFAAVSSLST